MKVFFHIGYPRTGTTFLQANIFPFHSQINYLGPKHHFYGDQPEVKVYLKNDLLKKQLGIDEFEKLIFSLDNIAQTKKEVCEFFELYDYYKVYNELKEIFGEKNIKILEYENFKEDPQDFFSRLSEILKIENSEINNLLNKHKLNVLNQNQNQLIIENSITIFLGNLLKKLNLNKIIPKFLKRKIKILLSTKILITKYDQNKLRSIVKSYYKNSNTNFKNQTGVKFLTT